MRYVADGNNYSLNCAKIGHMRFCSLCELSSSNYLYGIIMLHMVLHYRVFNTQIAEAKDLFIPLLRNGRRVSTVY